MAKAAKDKRPDLRYAVFFDEDQKLDVAFCYENNLSGQIVTDGNKHWDKIIREKAYGIFIDIRLNGYGLDIENRKQMFCGPGRKPPTDAEVTKMTETAANHVQAEMGKLVGQSFMNVAARQKVPTGNA